MNGAQAAEGGRSPEPITGADLRRLVDLARARLAQAFGRGRSMPGFRDRLFALCLAQGAADHLLDGRTGVRDFDVWCFFRARPDLRFPHRARWTADFGPSRFGRPPDLPGRFAGRKVDLLGRAVAWEGPGREGEAVALWLAGGSASAGHLRRKSVVGLWPEALFGRVFWDHGRPPSAGAGAFGGAP